MAESGPIPVREGELVAGKYRVGTIIGVGGMGVIVAARHEQLDQPVAIKFVRGEALGNDEAVQRFLREARAAAKLKSEHVAKVLDVGTLETGVPYMVMELLEGSDLARTIADQGPVAVEVAADWIAQACEALAEAHAAGIVHRDLKPQNLFLARTVGGAAKIKVLDFGVSKSSGTMTGGPGGALTRTSAMLGSPLYMAPEQMRSSRDVDARTDIWALGVVLFELLSQRWPFEAETLPELCLKVVSDPPRSLREMRPDLPEAVVRVVERCLEKDVGNRYAHAAELASALEPFLPPMSRAVVERARMAIARPPEGATPARSMKMNLPAPTQVARVPSRMAPTPAAWGSGKGNGRTMTATRSPLLWTVVALLAGGGIGGGVLLLKKGTRDDPPPTAGAGVTQKANDPVPALPPPTPATESHVVLAPLATDATQPGSPEASSVETKAPGTVLSAIPQAGNRAMPPPPSQAHKPAAAKTAPHDDDIPALR